uniref:Uncharacterized protein n=1 Tax=Anguilla anguilla TaxID=7936 RepID=A0A0E9XM33_ANGAN
MQNFSIKKPKHRSTETEKHSVLYLSYDHYYFIYLFFCSGRGSRRTQDMAAGFVLVCMQSHTKSAFPVQTHSEFQWKPPPHAEKPTQNFLQTPVGRP